MQLVADAVDPLPTFLVVLHDQLAPAGSHDPAKRHCLGGGKRARFARDVAFQQLDCLDDRLVRVVVGAELQCVQQRRQKAAVLSLV